MTLKRREFMFDLGALVAAPPLRLLKNYPEEKRRVAARFSEEEALALEAMCEQIFPKDDFPGAKELGVSEFLTQTLLNSHPDWMVVYRSGLQALQSTSRAAHGRPFEKLGFDEQMKTLSMMEEGKLPGPGWDRVSPRDFFQLVRDHTLQGVYSHPRYGGNKGKGAWKMIGYDDWWA
jgi:gluconate 2-dehydrogenase gamma chain